MQRNPLLMLALPPKLSAKNKKDCPKGSLKSRTAFVRNGKKQPETASEPFQAAFVCLLLLLLDRHHDFVALFAAAVSVTISATALAISSSLGSWPFFSSLAISRFSFLSMLARAL